MFKIRDKTSGLFSGGGTSPNWTVRGKTWSGRGPVILSLLGYDRGNRVPLSNIEVVEFETIEKSTQSATDVIRESRERQQVKKQRAKDRCEKWQRERDEQAFEELRVRLGK